VFFFAAHPAVRARGYNFWMRSRPALWLCVLLFAMRLPAQDETPLRVAAIHEAQIRGVHRLPADEVHRFAIGLRDARFEGPDWLHAAIDKVRAFCQQRGYFRVQVTASSTELPGSTAAAAAFDVVFTVDEGPQYRLGAIAFPTRSDVFSSEELRSLIPLADGDVLDSAKVIAGLDAIRAAYSQRGYATFKLNPGYGFDEKRRLLYLNVSLVEGKPYRLGKVEISGPDQSLVETLRSRFPLHPGDLYDGTQVDAFYRDNDLLLQGGCASCTALNIDERAGVVDVRIDLALRRKAGDP
jgi:outer membrane protein assembly factor BamA